MRKISTIKFQLSNFNWPTLLMSYLLSLITLSLLVTPIYAQSNLINQVQKLENQATKAATKQETALDQLKKRADDMVNQRITDLNNLISRIQNDKRLTVEGKNSLTTNIQTNITGLTMLKAKIDADNDLATARADTKQVVTSFRVYLVLEPKIRLLVTIDNLLATTTNLQGLTPQLENIINNQKAKGKNTKAAQTALDDINTRLASISAQLSTNKTEVEATTPTDVNSAHATFVLVRQDLAKIRASFAEIRSDLAKMRQSLR